VHWHIPHSIFSNFQASLNHRANACSYLSLGDVSILANSSPPNTELFRQTLQFYEFANFTSPVFIEMCRFSFHKTKQAFFSFLFFRLEAKSNDDIYCSVALLCLKEKKQKLIASLQTKKLRQMTVS
jgi:hypothetical protein